MKTIFLVKSEEAELARLMERKLLALPAESGILFVGVEVLPVTDVRFRAMYQIFIGCSREMETGAVSALARHTLRDILEDGDGRLIIETRRGVGRSSQAS